MRPPQAGRRYNELMKLDRKVKALFLAGPLLIAAAACRTPKAFGPSQRSELAQSVTRDWSEGARLTANRLIEKYGPPDAIASGALAWKNKPPWRRILVWDDPLGGNLEEAVSYRVPDGKRAALKALDGIVQVSPDGAELSAQSSGEPNNFLALNIAHEIIRGDMNPADARHFYDKTLDLAASGKTSRYLQGLLFGAGSGP